MGGNEVGQHRYPRLSHKNPVPSIGQGGQTKHCMWNALQQVPQYLDRPIGTSAYASGHHAHCGNTPL